MGYTVEATTRLSSAHTIPSGSAEPGLATMATTLEGSLEDFSIIELLQLISMGNKTGILDVHNLDTQNIANLYFDSGLLTHLQLKQNVEPLNIMLIKAGHLTAEKSRFAHDQQKTNFKNDRYGGVLLKLNLVSRHTLRKTIHQQMEEALYSIFEWQKGMFAFKEMPNIDPADFPLGTKAEELVLEGSRRMDEWNRMRKHIPHYYVIFTLKEKVEDESQFLDLEPIEWEILSNIDGIKTVKDLAMRLGIGTFETCESLIELIRKGLVEPLAESLTSGETSV